MRELQATGECELLGVGVFRLKVGRRTRIIFRAAPRLLAELKDSKFLEREPDHGLKDELSNAVEEKAGRLFFHTLGAPRAPISLTRNFAYYLKNHFPLDNPWVNPLTKVEYSLEDIRSAIEVYQEVDPHGYMFLWMLWVSVNARDRLVTKYRINPTELITKWYLSVESILFILFNPDLVPTRLEETSLNTESTHPRSPRKKLDYYLAPFQEQ